MSDETYRLYQLTDVTRVGLYTWDSLGCLYDVQDDGTPAAGAFAPKFACLFVARRQLGSM